MLLIDNESNTALQLDILEKICKELDCNFGDLVDYVPDEEEK